MADMTTSSREAFEAAMKTMDGYPFARQFANLMWKSWQAAREDCAQIADSYASDVGIAQAIAAEIRGER